MINKSNDSFQWSDALVKEVVYWIGRGLISQDRASDEVDSFKFIKTPLPKPQAENKPDWEIVDMKHKYGDRKVTNGTYDYTWAMSVNSEHWEIHSVKRLSDGEVFSLDEYTVDGKIKRFEVYNELHIKAWLYPTEGYDKYLWFHQCEKLPPQPQKEEQPEEDLDWVEIEKYRNLFDSLMKLKPSLENPKQ